MKLVGKLKESVAKSENKEQAKEAIKHAGMELTDDEMNMVSGGIENAYDHNVVSVADIGTINPYDPNASNTGQGSGIPAFNSNVKDTYIVVGCDHGEYKIIDEEGRLRKRFDSF